MKQSLFNLFSFSILLLALVCTSCKDESSVQPYVTYETHINLAGQINMRDLGGLYGANGKRVLYHKLFRSGDLSKLTASDLDSLTALGIKQVIDLRTSSEITSAPDKLPTSGITSTNLPLLASATGGLSQSQLMGGIMQGTISAETFMLSIYNSVDSLKEANWTKAFALIQTGNTTLYHCTAGKDRAGMTTAIILSALGVSKDDIIGDFMASNEYMATYISQEVSAIDAAYGAGTGAKLKPMFDVEDAYIYAFFNAVDAKYGSMDNFLVKLGIDKVKMQKLFLEK